MLDKAYDPQGTEDRIYNLWEESGAFIADNTSDKEPFTISMPPPNATGQLHLGHAVMLALEDIFIRYARMQGKEALWVPGTDHAAIATESVVIRKIQKEEEMPDPRGSLGREELLKRIAHFVDNSKDTIRGQVRKMGSSCDWSREGYTMDPTLNRIVNEMFVKMQNDGLIYRGERVVNWDTALQTTISDDEIEHKDAEAVLYTFEYLSADQTGGDPLYVSTSRPETKLGDTALAVHPDDERYAHLIGKEFDVQWPHGCTVHVTVIADHEVDPEFGTGVIGVTPFHSKIDYDLWQRHKAEISAAPQQVIGEDGKMMSTTGEYADMKISECREKFVEGLRDQGRIKSEEKYIQPLAISYRSKKAVEPLPKLQWFIDVNKKVNTWKGKWEGKNLSLKEVMLDVVKEGDIEIIPGQFEKTYFHWIENLQDWCISRQIWWGHQIPVWYCLICQGEGAFKPENKMKKEDDWSVFASTKPLKECPTCGCNDARFVQDQDTLDTWFSAALWTWSTLIDKNLADDFSLSLEDLLAKSPDFQKFHPTQIMETGYDILFFWVARMILMTTYGTGQIPFEKVYLHGLVRTRDGAKMSKSHPETMIDPLDIIEKYGADALRMSMIVGQSPGSDQKLYEEKIAGYRNFINKLWNASRFVLMQCEEAGVMPAELNMTDEELCTKLSPVDQALFSSLQKLTDDVRNQLRDYRLSDAGERLYSFVWDYYCDWYLERSKGQKTAHAPLYALRTLLKLLHPYCPFVTEELWHHMKPLDAKILMLQDFPEPNQIFNNEDAENDFNLVNEVISAIRRMRADNNVPVTKRVDVKIVVDLHHFSVISVSSEDIFRMAKLDNLYWDGHMKSKELDTFPEKNFVSEFFRNVEVHLSLEGLIDTEKEKEKLLKEQEKLEGFIRSGTAKLANEKFVANAKAEVVAMEREKLASSEAKLAKIIERLQQL